MIFLDILRDYNIILASQSPRRQFLLKEAGIDYTLAPKIDVDESFNKKLKKEKIPLYLSKLKADAHKNNLKQENDILVTADTIVWQKSNMLGKPTSEKDALKIVKQLSNSKHHVFTGVTLTSLNKQVSFYSKSTVYFDKLSKDEIEFYIENYKPFDKAGASGIQEWIGYIGIKKIEGSFYNVMGLPVHQVYVELKKFIDFKD